MIVIRLMQQQNVNVKAIHFVSPFFGDSPNEDGGKYDASRAAALLNVPINIYNLCEEYLEMLRKPCHGYGKAINPCIDCHAYFLKKAKEFMISEGADFIVTGEVLGQRPMSQRRDALRVVEKESGTEGLLLRPLSACFLKPTIPELEGWIDREKLPAVKGRSRKEQIRLAKELGITEYPNPAGGCFLTEVSYASKVRDVFEHSETLNPHDFRLLRLGRHFRLSPYAKFIVGRNEAENRLLESNVQPGEAGIYWRDGKGPFGLVVGDITENILQVAGKILLRYTKAETGVNADIEMLRNGVKEFFVCCNSMKEQEMEEYRI